MAQAAPGPLAPPPGVQSQTQAAPVARPTPKPKPPQLPTRTSLAGSWKFNHDDSDDPLQKVRSAESSTVNTNAGRGPSPMGYPGGGYPYPGGYPGGGPWGGYPGGGGGPRQGSGGEDIAGNPKMQPFIHPPDIMDVDIKKPEVDVTDDHFKKLIIYTDGRQLPKKIDEDHPEIVAHWSGSQLVSDEKSPLSGKMSRTYELSGDGRKLYETVHIDHGKRPAIVIRYVYDATKSDVQSGLGTDDPDRPVIKRHSESDDSSDTSPEPPQ
jgi:hypothetical protein